MVKKAKEKVKKKNTKEETAINLDNEIIIGIKPIAEPKVQKKKNKAKKNANKKNSLKKDTTQKREKNKTLDDIPLVPKQKNNKKKQTKKTNKKKQPTQNKKKVIDELDLGIEERTKKKTKNKKITKKQEMAKRKRKIVFRAVKYSILLVILISSGIYFLLSPFFNIKEITVSGNTKITKEEIFSLSGIKLEENTFKLQIQQVEQSIKQNAYVEKVTVKRSLPDKIEINITERIPTFMLIFANAYVYINNQGYLLEVSKTTLDVPMMTGFLTPEEDIHVGNRLCSEDLQRLDQALQIMKSAESNGIGDLVTKINISDKQDYILELKSEKKTVHIGDNSNLSTKMLYIISILEENKGVEGEIFVNTDLSNKGAIFRKKI